MTVKTEITEQEKEESINEEPLSVVEERMIEVLTGKQTIAHLSLAD